MPETENTIYEADSSLPERVHSVHSSQRQLQEDTAAVHLPLLDQ